MRLCRALNFAQFALESPCAPASHVDVQSSAAFVSHTTVRGRRHSFVVESAKESLAAVLQRENKLRERLRLGYVIDWIGDWDLGGTERQLVRLVERLDHRSFEPTVFVLQDSPGALTKDIGCPVVLVNRNSKVSRFHSFLNLLAAFKRFRPHIVQTFFFDGTFYGTAAAWLAGVPAIVQSRRNAGYWQKARHRFALRLLNRLVDSWQCNSRCVAELLESTEGIPRERIEILRNSIDLVHFSPVTSDERLAARSNLSLPHDVPIFIAVSTLRPIKGLSTIVEAAARLRAHLPKALFLLVGEGPERKTLSAQIEEFHLSDTVRLVGPQSDVRPWLAAADIGLLASYSESSSNALLEYMAMGLPAVVSDIPANRELVEGLYFVPGNAGELAERILWLWNHSEVRQQMGRKYRQRAIPYGDTAFAKRVENYYIQLAGNCLHGPSQEN